GVEYQGYKSDLTRVFFLGKINTLVARVYDIVLTAQARALALIKPGVKPSIVDKAARQYISDKGYGRYFVHSLGHGIGLQIHEAPSLSAKVEQVLRPGMVFTVEPGIYLPGRFGIRIEDMVLVTRKGCEVISGSLNK
ncbi:MAG: M24 family metallopeptidase, partial [Candidatus Omnitrophota bacterium]